MRCLLNGEVVQDDSTANIIFSVAELISYASRSTQLEAGDIIATGTPAGVALGQAEPCWLQAGDTVVAAVEGIGTLRNPILRESAPEDSVEGPPPFLYLPFW